jgi:hypothetical protein
MRVLLPLLLPLLAILGALGAFANDLGRPANGSPQSDLRLIALFHSYDVVEDVIPAPPAHVAQLAFDGKEIHIAEEITPATVIFRVLFFSSLFSTHLLSSFRVVARLLFRPLCISLRVAALCTAFL